MRMQPGNQFWKQRSRHGIQPIFPEGAEGARKLREACEDYFAWCEANPLLEDRIFAYNGRTHHDAARKLRAFTLDGLLIFIDVEYRNWRVWRENRSDLVPILQWAECVIRNQKFTAAAAGLLNATIIARDLGLAERSEISGPDGAPIRAITTEMDAQEAAELYARTREG